MTREEERVWDTVIGGLLAGPICLLMTPIALPATIWKAWVLKTLWLWFVVPTVGLRPLSLAGAAGIWIVAGYLTQRPNYADVKQKPLGVQLLGTVFGPLLTLLLGWLVRWLLGVP